MSSGTKSTAVGSESDYELLVELHCERSLVSDVRKISFTSTPTTIQEIKEKVEECCSVPVCVQTVYYHSELLLDDCVLSTLYMRSGDSIKVTFPERGECDKVKEVTQWLTAVIPLLRLCQYADETMLEGLNSRNISILVNEEKASLMSRELFYPWNNKVKSVNCSHFVYLNGVDLLVTFHKHAIELRRSNDCQFARYLSTYFEVICSQTVANFAVDFACRRLLFRGEGLEQCIQSFLIKPADDESLLFNHAYSIVDVALYAVCK